ASHRHWGRIDRSARDVALRRHDRARSGLEGAKHSVERAQARLDHARAEQAHHEQALAATAAQRQELTQAMGELDAALERTRPERVLALARQEITPVHLVEALGPLSDEAGPRAVWCGLAEEVERFRDRHPGRSIEGAVNGWYHPELHADQAHLRPLLARAPELIATGDQLSLTIDPLAQLSPGGWAAQLEQAQALAPRLPEPALEQSLGMELGW
nr:hypothetical protein [Actinomycetota bacterium]